MRRSRGGSDLVAIRPAHVDRSFEKLAQLIQDSIQRREARKSSVPKLSYPSELPVVEARPELLNAIREHQVVIVCGETGSGKTTQLPKICLELGRGIAGMIGHTQPRRIAARTVAGRIAEELRAPFGREVGYKVRFGDRTSPETLVKVMTDGILLAETQHDSRLEQYDTIIIDEAHERSINIDFLLGYLSRLLPRRPDLKLIVTSATINPEQFSTHFGGAPIVEVSGRSYPVEVLYRPLGGREAAAPEAEDPAETVAPDEADVIGGILRAVDEAGVMGAGDILVFLPGEREIRETAEALHQRVDDRTEILALYARLATGDQDRVFRPSGRRRIVLATNVAETSLTVPGIRYVIDPGYARISRYTARRKIQRLPIEAISRASANQRKGRCGRVGPGVCFRLYSEADYNAREEFTQPEILRTNLAGAVLQMKALGLGEIESFPFIEPPPKGMVRDALHTLFELGAIDGAGELTAIGRELSRLPVDPRIGRMLIAGAREHALREILIVASALAIQDPRERPMDRRDAADAAHREYRDETSDFLTLLNLWRVYEGEFGKLSRGKLHKWCRDRFLSPARMREWHDTQRQLRTLLTEHGHKLNPRPAEPDAIHRALLTGLLGNIGRKADVHEFAGAHGTRFYIFPGSALFKAPPQWVMAGELAETTRLYARMVGPVQPKWIEDLAGHLVKRTYSEPFWDEASSSVIAYERVTLYGLEVVARRRRPYGPVDPAGARELFIHHGLVMGELRTQAPFMKHNRAVFVEVQQFEEKVRKRDLIVDQQAVHAFFDRLLPPDVWDGGRFERWRKQVEAKDPHTLFLSREDILRDGARNLDERLFPDRVKIAGSGLDVRYRYAPGETDDGATLIVPISELAGLRQEACEQQIPGHLAEAILAMIRGLPKDVRRLLGPAPEVAARCIERIDPAKGGVLEQARLALGAIAGFEIQPSHWNAASLPEHLRSNFRVVDANGEVLAEGRELDPIKQSLAARIKAELSRLDAGGFTRSGLTSWDFEEIPVSMSVNIGGRETTAYPALRDDGTSVSLVLAESQNAAESITRAGLRRLFAIHLRRDVKLRPQDLPGIEGMYLRYASIGKPEDLRERIMLLLAERTFMSERMSGGGGIAAPRSRESYEARLDDGWRRLAEAKDEVCSIVMRILEEAHSLSMAMEMRVPDEWHQSIEDLRSQVLELLGPEFLSSTPWEWLRSVPRYLRGARQRLEKITSGGADRDRKLLDQLLPWLHAWRELSAVVSDDPDALAEIVRFRWMIEEYRVSLFAQELGTAVPVSDKRLEKQYDRIRRSLGAH